jgi:hypothetical protein
LEYVLPDVVFAEYVVRDRVLVCLRVLNAGNSLALSGIGDRPAGFSNLDGLAGRGSNGLIKGAKEIRVRVFDGVVDGTLIVWVGVYAKEVDSSDYS